MSEMPRPTGSGNAALAVLIFACVWAGPLVTLGGIHFTGDRLLGLAAVVALGVLALRRGLRWTAVHSALAVFTAIQVLTSLLATSAWPSAFKFSSIYVLGFACFALAAAAAAGRDGPRQGTRFWIVLGALLGLLGASIAFAANLRQSPLWGTGIGETLRYDDGTRVEVFAAKGPFNEWNLYSSFLIIAFALALWAWEPEREGQARRWGGYLSVSGVVLGLVFGLTRAAWVAMVCIAALWIWARRPAPRQIGGLALAIAVGFLLQATAIGASPLQFRVLQPLQVGTDENLRVRGVINRATIRSGLRRPLFGNGAGSINRLVIPGAGSKPWNGNLVLFVLHDSGLPGVAALAGVVTVVALMARRAYRRSTDRTVLVPLLVAGVALLWAYQFTHGLWLMYPYVYLGLLTASMDGGSEPA